MVIHVQAQVPALKTMPYAMYDGTRKDAKVFGVPVDLSSVNSGDIRVIEYLTHASYSIGRVFARQMYQSLPQLLHDLARYRYALSIDSEHRADIENYTALVSAACGPWNSRNIGFVFPDGKDARNASDLNSFYELLTNCPEAPKGRGFYPAGTIKEDIERLDGARTPNSAVVRDEGGGLKVVLNETLYAEELKRAIEWLYCAVGNTSYPKLKEYINAAIEELRTGSSESRDASFAASVANDSPIDFTMTTASETYMDRLMGVRAAAEAGIFTVNNTYQSFADDVLRALPNLEQQAPWQCKKDYSSGSPPVRLRFVDVVTRSGGYDMFPISVDAQMLPNYPRMERYGRLNRIFANVTSAIERSAKGHAERLFPRHALQYSEAAEDARLKFIAAHELGHSSGGIEIDDPQTAFGTKYALLEELRAELFSMWAMDMLYKSDKIDIACLTAGNYCLLLDMLMSLQQKPFDHAGACNAMFHYFRNDGVIKETMEHGTKKYDIDAEKSGASAGGLLGVVGDIKAAGNTEGLDRLMATYISDDMKAEIQAATQSMPRGNMLIFPHFDSDKLVYPASFTDQPRIRALFAD